MRLHFNFKTFARASFDKGDRRKLVYAYLSQYLKELDEQLIEIIIDLPSAENPLYLKIILSELRVFGAFLNLKEKIQKDFGKTPESAFEGVLRRLEDDPAYSPIDPKQAVPLIFGLIAHARQGLSGDELISLLIQALKMDDTKENREAVSDTVYLFLRQVRPFLAQRYGRYDFFYESFKNATLVRYVKSSLKEPYPKRTTQECHQILATYFGSLPLWEDEKERKPTKRKVAELPYHQTMGEMWGKIEKTLTDPFFIEAKSKAGMLYDLVADYGRAEWAWPGQEEARKKENERLSRIRLYTEKLIAHAKDPQTNPLPDPPPLVEIRNCEPESDMHCECTRLERLKAWGHFVSTHLRQLADGEEPVFQMAWNSAATGPVAERVAEMEREGKGISGEWLRLRNRPPFTPNPACLKVLEGHAEWVEAVAITPDGGLAVSGSDDKTLRVWDLATGVCLKVLKGHAGWVRAVSITPDGGRVVSGSSDKSLRVWDLETGACLKAIEFLPDPVDAVSITADGGHAVSSDCCTLRLWDLATGECLKTLKGPDRLVTAVSITADGGRAVSGSTDNTLRVWDLAIGACLKVLEGHTSSVEAVSITPDGGRAVSGSYDETLRIWDLTTGKCLKVLEALPNSALSVSITPDGGRLVSGGFDNNLLVWNLATGTHLTMLKGHTIGVEAVSVTSDGERAVSNDDKILIVWDLATGSCIEVLEGHTSSINAVSITPDGRRAVSAGGYYENTLRVWDLVTGSCIEVLEGHTSSIHAVSITPDGRCAVSGSEDKTLRVWDLATGACLKVLEGHKGGVNIVVITPDGLQAVSSSYDITCVWDLTTGACVKKLIGHKSWDRAISITPDGRQVVSGGRDITLSVWDLATGARIVVREMTSPVYSMAVHGSSIVAGAFSGRVDILTIENYRPDRAAITAARLWLFDRSMWDANLTALCPWCGGRFNADPFFDTASPSFIRQSPGTPKTYVLKSPEIICPMPRCGKPLKLNPFVCDNS